MKEFTVIIPTWNMGRYLPALFHSVVNSPFAEAVEEILFVCEKSDDGSEDVIAGLIREQGDRPPRARMIQPEVRRGHFMTRYAGAAAAKTEKLFFIDSRIVLPKATGEALPRLAKQYPAMCTNIDIDPTKNIFCLYWKRSHDAIFSKTFEANKGVNIINAQNYDEYRIGTGCFFCTRRNYLAACEPYLDSGIFSDDTLLLKDLVRREPIAVHPEFRVNWEPRSDWKSFLKHLYGRGPGFAEYHIFERRGWLFWAMLCGTAYLLAILLFLVIQPLVSLALVATALAICVLSTAFFAKSQWEFFELAPLHVAVILAYGFGALRGVLVVLRTRRRRPVKTRVQ